MEEMIARLMVPGLAGAVAALAAAFCAAAEAGKADVPRQLEGPIRKAKVNGGTIARRYLEDKRGGQDVAVWIHDDTKVVRGVLLSLHQGSEAWRSDFQEFAQSQDFALFGTLIRWADFEKVLPDQLAKVGAALGHPEVANVPWACIGGSRNVGALLNFTRLHPDGASQLLCLLFSGGPGPGLRYDRDAKTWSREDLDLFAGIPILTVNGSADPFVGGMDWQLKVYPRIRKLNLPYGVAVDWDCGHAPEEAPALWWPFVKAAVRARYPTGADPTKGRLQLRPLRYADGWLIGPVDWKTQWGDSADAVAKYKGDVSQTVWLPDEACVKVWRSFVSKDTPARVAFADGELTVTHLPGEPNLCKVAYFADGDDLGEVAGWADEPYAVKTGKLASGAWSVHAEITYPVEVLRTPPIVVCNGAQVDWRAGRRAAEIASLPIHVVEVPAAAKETIHALRARRSAADTWKLAFADDFEKGIKDAWYDYYRPRPDSEVRRGHEDDKHEHVDGTMQLSSKLHAVAMLPYDWPRDVAVEYRARAVGERICDLSVVLSGNPSGSDFPWREGMMYQFGAHLNQGSFFLVREQPYRDWKAFDDGARIEPGKWHTVRVERLGGVAKAYVDDRPRSTREISPSDFERFYGQKIGLYTFGSTAQFDDVKVYVRAASDPASVKPAMPDEAALDAATAALLEAMGSPFGEQRDSAWRLLRVNSHELAGALRRRLDAGKIGDEGTKARVEQVLAGRRPG